MIGGPGLRWLLRVESGTLRLEGRRGEERVAAMEAPWATLEELRVAIAALAVEVAVRPAPRRIVALLTRPLVQRRTIAGLPRVGRTRARAIVTTQTGRYFRAGSSLVVDLARPGPGADWTGFAAEESLLDAVVAGADAAGLTITAIRPADEQASISLLPPTCLAARRVRRARRAGIGLAASLLLCLGLVGLAASRWIVEARSLQLAADSLRAPVAALARLHSEMARAVEMLEAIDRADRERAVVTRQLLILARALPDSALLTSLSLTESGSGRLTGLARRPLALVAELDRTHALPNPRLEGGTFKEVLKGRPWERFTLAFGDEVRR